MSCQESGGLAERRWSFVKIVLPLCPASEGGGGAGEPDDAEDVVLC